MYNSYFDSVCANEQPRVDVCHCPEKSKIGKGEFPNLKFGTNGDLSWEQWCGKHHAVEKVAGLKARLGHVKNSLGKAAGKAGSLEALLWSEVNMVHQTNIDTMAKGKSDFNREEWVNVFKARAEKVRRQAAGERAKADSMMIVAGQLELLGENLWGHGNIPDNVDWKKLVV